MGLGRGVGEQEVVKSVGAGCEVHSGPAPVSENTCSLSPCSTLGVGLEQPEGSA